MRAHGPSGEVRVGHRVAAVLGDWDIQPRGVIGQVPEDGPWSLLAEVEHRDTFWLANAAKFDLVLETRDSKTLRFRGVRVIDEEMISALGEGLPEES